MLDDRFVEVVAEGFDLAIRIGTLADSSLKARKLAETRMVIVAAPAYLAEAGTPRTIDDLNDHRLLHYSQLATGNFWRLRTPLGEERQVRVGGRLTVNNGEALMRAAEAGIGIALVPSFMLGDALATGRLVEILASRPPDVFGIYARLSRRAASRSRSSAPSSTILAEALRGAASGPRQLDCLHGACSVRRSRFSAGRSREAQPARPGSGRRRPPPSRDAHRAPAPARWHG